MGVFTVVEMTANDYIREILNPFMLSQEEFLIKYNISSDSFAQTGLKWEDLVAIFNEYSIFRSQLEPSAIYLFNTLMKAPKVHSVRYRIKDAEHLIEKIVRKKIESKESNITIENYKDEMLDLIGLRALHLFKEDWEPVNDYIKSMWNLKQPPVANYRQGDSEQLVNFFKTKGCEAKEHKFGYRSVHYIIETQPAKQKYHAEIQVRTIFEEAWSEIDHTIRYPYHLGNKIFFQFLLILNRLAGSADEMGSFILLLKDELAKKDKEFAEKINEKSSIIADLEKKIDALNLQGVQIDELKADVERLKRQNFSSSLFELPNLANLQTSLTSFVIPEIPSNLLKALGTFADFKDLSVINREAPKGSLDLTSGSEK